MKLEQTWMNVIGACVVAPDKDGEIEVRGDDGDSFYLDARELYALLTVHFDGQPLTAAEIADAYMRSTD